MKVIGSTAAQRITERLTVMTIQMATKAASVQDVQQFVQKTIEMVDEELEGLCRPHDWVRLLGEESKMACARCGDETVRDYRIVPAEKEADVRSPSPVPQAISISSAREIVEELKGPTGGTILLRKPKGETNP